MRANAVVGLGCVPVPNQQAILIGEMLDPVSQQRIILEAEVVRASAQAIIIAALLAEFSDVCIEVEAGFGTGGHAETGEGPTSVAFSAVS